MLSSVESRIRRQYWARVKGCLVNFHDYSPNQAARKVSELQTKFPIASRKPSVELIYHIEPFQLACKITQRKLSVKDYVAKYQQILAETSISESTRERNYKTIGEKLSKEVKSTYFVRESKPVVKEKSRKELEPPKSRKPQVRKNLLAVAAASKAETPSKKKKDNSKTKPKPPATSSRKKTRGIKSNPKKRPEG